jgi:hypothetical protein
LMPVLACVYGGMDGMGCPLRSYRFCCWQRPAVRDRAQKYGHANEGHAHARESERARERERERPAGRVARSDSGAGPAATSGGQNHPYYPAQRTHSARPARCERPTYFVRGVTYYVTGFLS